MNVKFSPDENEFIELLGKFECVPDPRSRAGVFEFSKHRNTTFRRMKRQRLIYKVLRRDNNVALSIFGLNQVLTVIESVRL